MTDFDHARWAAFTAHLHTLRTARLQAAATAPQARQVLAEHWEDADRWGYAKAHHVVTRNARGDLFYEVTCESPVSRERHEVWTDTEIADLLETDDGPFCLQDHEWQELPCGLLLVRADGHDWYVLPEVA